MIIRSFLQLPKTDKNTTHVLKQVPTSQHVSEHLALIASVRPRKPDTVRGKKVAETAR